MFHRFSAYFICFSSEYSTRLTDLQFRAASSVYLSAAHRSVELSFRHALLINPSGANSPWENNGVFIKLVPEFRCFALPSRFINTFLCRCACTHTPAALSPPFSRFLSLALYPSLPLCLRPVVPGYTAADKDVPLSGRGVPVRCPLFVAALRVTPITPSFGA